MLLWICVTSAVTAVAYWWTRNFVRDRLRFVDAVQHPAAPAVAGAAAAALAVPLGALLPTVTAASGLIVGTGVALGVMRGRTQSRLLPHA